MIITAGCNGAGKSTFSKDYVEDLIPFDIDKRFMEIYSSMKDSELRTQISYNQSIDEFEYAINKALDNNHDFCYETNFHGEPVYWAEKAKTKGYHVELHFYCLESIELAVQRVQHRVNFNGHPVEKSTIDYKWKEGYKNLNIHFNFFDRVLLIDNSLFSQPKNMFTLIKDSNNNFEVEFYTKQIPEYAKRRFPEIYKILINSHKSKNILNHILKIFTKNK